MLSFTRVTRAALAAGAFAATAAPAVAQSRLVLPAGTVILVKTNTALESSSAKAGQTFEATVDQDMVVDDYSVLPPNTRVGGTITLARATTRSQSGVIDVHFDRLIFADGSSVAISGKLTSTDSAERRQINADPNAHVVLVGARGGIGAAIAGAGGSQSPNSILSALGGLLSEGRDVAVPAGTQLAVELERAVTLRGRNRVAAGDPRALYTSADRVRSAQQALAQRNYYRGSTNGSLDNATRRALFAFQIDNGMTGTGNLDGRTAQLLGVALAAGSGVALTADQSSALRRDAQNLMSRYRTSIGMSASGRMSPNRAYTQGELEMLFALSAFVDNSSMYEQLVRSSGSADAAARAGRALVNAARRVDAAGTGTPMAADMTSMWSSVRRQLSAIEAANPGT